MALRGRLGRYRLVRRLAVGGMAEVYLAVAEGLSGFEKRVVIKRLLPQHACEGELLAMFLDEARLVAALKHPNIGEVYDVGAEDGEYFFAMEYIAGRDLRDLLAAAEGEPLPLPEALAVTTALGEALHHAHEQRDDYGRLLEIVHRDVSPSNVLVSAAGQVKLVDFGVAKWAAQRTETRHGVLKGKCAYMSPEQCRAEPLDRRSDVFSLGVLLYEITTGRRPFEGQNDFETMTAIVQGTLSPPSARRPGYPAALEPIVLRALAPRRDERYGTALELARDLTAFAATAGLTPSAAGLAALLSALFGEEAGGTVAEPEPEDEVASPSRAAISPARSALDRTATDHHATATIAPLVLEELSSGGIRTPGARRLGIYAGLGLACIVVVVTAAWMGKPSTVAAPLPPVSAPRPRVTAPAFPRVMHVTAEPEAAVAPVAPPAQAVRRPKAARRAPVPASPAVKVWDPDSPVPPPP